MRAWPTIDDARRLFADLRPGAAPPINMPFLSANEALWQQAHRLRLEDEPAVVAECVGRIVLARAGKRLVLAGRPFARTDWPNLMWVFRGDVLRTNAGVRVGSLALAPWPEAEKTRVFRGLSQAVLRAVPLNEIVRLALAELEQQAEVDQLLTAIIGEGESYWARRRDELVEAVARDRERLAQEHRGRGRLPHPDTFYQLVAVTYLELAARGPRASVHKELAKRLGHLKPRTAANLVAEARRRGYLASGSPGRVEARRGPKLLPR